MQISCHGELSPLWSHTFLVFMQPCGEPQERKKPLEAEITLARFEDVLLLEQVIRESHVIYFLFNTLNTNMDFYGYLALIILVETSGVQSAIFPNLLSS